jgi:hypothetical protein
MAHRRALGITWLILASIGFVLSVREFVRITRLDHSFDNGTLIAAIFCAVAAIAAVGSIRAKAWSQPLLVTVSVLVALYCMLFIAMVSLEFGWLEYVAAWLVLLLSVCTIFFNWRVRADKSAT